MMIQLKLLLNIRYLLGVLVKNIPKGLSNPSEYVLEDGYLYKGADFRLNGTNIVMKNNSNPTNLVSKIVVIYYKPIKDMTKIIKRLKKAPEDYGRKESMLQIRSDWTAEETGFSVGKSTKEKLKNITYFEVYNILEYKGLKLSKKDNKVNVFWKNMFDTDIQELSIIGHYEGGFGKPSLKYIEKKVGTLKQEKSVGIDFATIFQPNGTDGQNKKRRGSFRLNSILIKGKVKDTYFEIDKSAYF